MEKYEYAADVPEAYKTIINLIDVWDDEDVSLRTYGNSVETLLELYEEDAKMIVNGAEITSEDHFEQIITRDAETAELFDIQYTFTLKKADCNIFNMLY